MATACLEGCLTFSAKAFEATQEPLLNWEEKAYPIERMLPAGLGVIAATISTLVFSLFTLVGLGFACCGVEEPLGMLEGSWKITKLSGALTLMHAIVFFSLGFLRVSKKQG